jgi:hypothetical protein
MLRRLMFIIGTSIIVFALTGYLNADYKYYRNGNIEISKEQYEEAKRYTINYVMVMEKKEFNLTIAIIYSLSSFGLGLIIISVLPATKKLTIKEMT